MHPRYHSEISGWLSTKGIFHLNFAMPFTFTRKKIVCSYISCFQTRLQPNQVIQYIISYLQIPPILFFFGVLLLRGFILSALTDMPKLKFGFVPFLPAQDFS
jgi:hypothetical protein